MSKLKKLENLLKMHQKVLVAYSGGVDSTFLLAIAKKVLGKNVLAVIACSETYTKQELKMAKKFAKKIKVKTIIINTCELADPKFYSNPIDRCFYCKSELFKQLKGIAQKNKIDVIVDGSNQDDLKDYRPGSKAKKKFGVKSPLQKVGLTKLDIRKYSKAMKLPTWNLPAQACLASRIPYGQKITKKDLMKIEKAENYLRKLGFKECRVRKHGNIARIELNLNDVNSLLNNKLFKLISTKLRTIGFNYITLDLEGYRTGSLNLFNA